MLENLVELVKENAGDVITNNSQIPNEKKEAVISETANTIMAGLQKQTAETNLDSLKALLKTGNITTSPMTQSIAKNVEANLKQKFGLNDLVTGNIAKSLVPNVMNQFAKKTNDPNDNSFTMEGIMKSIAGKSGEVVGKVKDFFHK